MMLWIRKDPHLNSFNFLIQCLIILFFRVVESQIMPSLQYLLKNYLYSSVQNRLLEDYQNYELHFINYFQNCRPRIFKI